MEKPVVTIPPGKSLREIIERIENWDRHFKPRTKEPSKAETASLSERISDAITNFAGSMLFVYLHAVWFTVWIAANLGLFGPGAIFDPFPFGLLTMIVSLEAIYLSTFVLISQNRQAEVADERAEMDFEVNVRTEAEVAKVVTLLEAIALHLADGERQNGRAEKPA